MEERESEIVEYLERAKCGDEKAFEKIVELYTPLLYRLVYQITLNQADTEEIVQEAFYRFYLALKRLKERDPFPFLRKIALRRTYTFLKKKKIEVSFEDLSEEEKEFPIDGFNYELKEIYDFANALPPKRRMVFILRDILGFEDEEIAKELKISQITIRRHSQIAKEELRKRLKK